MNAILLLYFIKKYILKKISHYPNLPPHPPSKSYHAHNLPQPEPEKPLHDSVVETLKDILNGDLPTIILDATGNKESMQKCFEYVAASGTIVYIGLFIGDITFHDPLFHRKEITLKASRNALASDFMKLIRLLKAGLVHIDGYITHRLPFETLPETFTTLYLPEEKVIKAVIEF